MADQDLVTFYNDNEGWELATPIAPLMKSDVFAAMLSGQFREATSKRIRWLDFSQEVTGRFIHYLTTKNTSMPMSHGHSYSVDEKDLQLVRLAHRYNEQQLVEQHLQHISQFLHNSNFSAEIRYKFCKLIMELSIEKFSEIAKLVIQPYDVFQFDDPEVLLYILPRHGEGSLHSFVYMVRYKAYKCLKEAIQIVTSQPRDIHLLIEDKDLPEEILILAIKKYPVIVDNLIQRADKSKIGTVLRLSPDIHDVWSKAFASGHIEVIKFAPKEILIQNNLNSSFGLTALGNGWLNCVDILLEQGWKPTAAALNGALSLPSSVLKKLIAHGARPDANTIMSAKSQYQNVRPNHQSRMEALENIAVLEQVALENALESDLYKAYTKKDNPI